ncbi:MAG: hypothetical protein ACPGU7_12720 [Gammaproteobacteria bacterium]
MRKLHNRHSAPGLEWRILKKLPYAFVAGTVIPALMSLMVRFGPLAAVGGEAEKTVIGVDILAISIVITAWTAVFTVAIGCITVWLMKGPAYVADAYELHDAPKPGTRPRDS